MRLIDADAILINGIKNKTIEIRYEDLPGDLEKIFTLLFKDVRAFIDEQPTIDVVPAMHGHWAEKTGELNDATFWWYECSNCGGRPLKQWNETMLSGYCPWCGAKMDVTDTNVGNKDG